MSPPAPAVSAPPVSVCSGCAAAGSRAALGGRDRWLHPTDIHVKAVARGGFHGSEEPPQT